MEISTLYEQREKKKERSSQKKKEKHMKKSEFESLYSLMQHKQRVLLNSKGRLQVGSPSRELGEMREYEHDDLLTEYLCRRHPGSPNCKPGGNLLQEEVSSSLTGIGQKIKSLERIERERHSLHNYMPGGAITKTDGGRVSSMIPPGESAEKVKKYQGLLGNNVVHVRPRVTQLREQLIEKVHKINNSLAQNRMDSAKMVQRLTPGDLVKMEQSMDLLQEKRQKEMKRKMQNKIIRERILGMNLESKGKEFSKRIVRGYFTKGRQSEDPLWKSPAIPSFESTVYYETKLFSVNNKLPKNIHSLRSPKSKRRGGILGAFGVGGRIVSLKDMSKDKMKVTERTQVTQSALTVHGIANYNIYTKVTVQLPHEEAPEIEGINEFIRGNIANDPFCRILGDLEAEDMNASFESKLSDVYLQKCLDSPGAGKQYFRTGSSNTVISEQVAGGNYSLVSERIQERDYIRKELGQMSYFDLDERNLEFFEFNKKKARGKTKKQVPATDTSPEHGTVNEYGTIMKRIAKKSTFHARWMMLRGWNLYWYQEYQSHQQKAIILIGKQPIKTINVKEKVYIYYIYIYI